MSTLEQTTWQALNDAYVSASVAWVRALLAERIRGSSIKLAPKGTNNHAAPKESKHSWFGSRTSAELSVPKELPEKPVVETESAESAASRCRSIEEEMERVGGKSSLGEIAHRFGLTDFERDIIAFCLAFELDTRIGWMCGEIQDKPYCPYPTFGLAMTLFDNPDWNAIPPDQPLRFHRLLELRQGSGIPVHSAEIRLEETILHFLRGVQSIDPRLRLLMQEALPQADELVRSQSLAIERACAAMHETNGRLHLVQIIGSSSEECHQVACGIIAQLEHAPLVMSLNSLSDNTLDNDEIARLWRRDSTLLHRHLVIDGHDASGPIDSLRMGRLQRFALSSQRPLFLTSRERLESSGLRDVSIELPSNDVREQAEMWMKILAKKIPHPEPMASKLAQQFTLSMPNAVAATAVARQSKSSHTVASFCHALWQECRSRTRPRLEGLAQRIDVKATRADLVLTDEQQDQMNQICGQVRSRWMVYDQWGMSERMNRGLGISALFAGESGTGKTMAAEVLANELNLDLYRVDLSSVVNKYIGETEKHLRKLFDCFERCGAILLFDECDALFGKRSEVKDSHDRYANIEINYLLQRLETYRGLAILATNNRGALDTAFLRRLRFVVSFAMPTESERVKIWQRMLPDRIDKTAKVQIPVGKIDYPRLARFSMSGGSIQNVVLNAAFRAAASEPVGPQASSQVTMRELLLAIRDELLKLERPIHEAEFEITESDLHEEAA